jgi:polyisoprenyl-teichoic acid--peptidoglycan teichoic acid transferase
MRQARRRKPLWFRILGAAFYVSFLIGVLLVSSAFGFLKSGKMGTALINRIFSPKTPQEIFGSDTLTLLVLGCDEDLSYGGKKVLKSNARSDMILAVRIDFKHKQIGGISIPRDLLWEIPGYKKMKINAFHTVGGDDLSKQAVESVLGIPIDRVMAINYDAFQELVNLVGGVEVFVPKKMDYDDKAGKLFIHLKPGKQVLDGYKAMGFVRMRHSDSDFMRQDRQKDFMLAFKDTVVKKPWLLNAVADKAQEVMGGALNSDELLSLTLYAKTVSGDNIKMGMLPILEPHEHSGYGYYVEVDRVKFDQAMREFHMVDDLGQQVSLGR